MGWIATSQVRPAFEPPAELVSFVERHVRDTLLYAGAEKRSEYRDLLVVPALAQAVDANFEAIGRPFAVVTRDISSQGIGLVYTDTPANKLLAVQLHLADEVANLVTELKWFNAMGPFYYFGGPFVARLDAFPQ